MKRILAVVLMLTLLIGMVSCDTNEKNANIAEKIRHGLIKMEDTSVILVMETKK